MDVSIKTTVRTYAVNQNRAMHILAMEKFPNGPSGSRDAPGNMLDGIKLKQTFLDLHFRVDFDQSGQFTAAEAEAGIQNFIDGMDPAVDMAGVSILTHGDYDHTGQTIEFSDGSARSLCSGQIIFIIIITIMPIIIIFLTIYAVKFLRPFINSPKLKDKPKILVIQACRGKKLCLNLYILK